MILTQAIAWAMISKKTKEDGIMKRFLLFALCAVVALASCQKADETGIAPEQSSLKVTAVIADNSTRVDYEVVDNTVNPTWAVETRSSALQLTVPSLSK